MPGFQRVNPVGDAFVRGPARLLVEPVTAIYPPNLGSIINLTTTNNTTEVQSIAMSGTPTGGTFTLAFMSVQTAAIAYNATSNAVQAALQSLPGIGSGGVTCSGGPLPTTPVVVTFAGANAMAAQPLITVPFTGMMLIGGTTPAVAVTRTTAGFGLYDPVGSWTDLGSTKSGVSIDRNNTETMIDVDQILQAVLSIPDEWEMTVTTEFAETTLENLQLAWEGGSIVTDATQTPNERHLGLGGPLAYTQKRLAVVHQKTVGTSAQRIRAHVFRIVQRSPQSSRMTFNKTGNQQTIPHVFRSFADPTVADPKAQFGEVIEQLFA
jgi:hypothetical protein